MIDHGYWFYEELREKVGVGPGLHRGDKEDSYIWLDTPHASYHTKVSSLRMELFRKDPRCVSCSRVGSLWILQSHRSSEPPHLNLFHVGTEEVSGFRKLSRDGLVLMTKDHIIPRSMGGPTNIGNLQVMCSICNGQKGSTITNRQAWEAHMTLSWKMKNLHGIPHFK